MRVNGLHQESEVFSIVCIEMVACMPTYVLSVGKIYVSQQDINNLLEASSTKLKAKVKAKQWHWTWCVSSLLHFFYSALLVSTMK